MSPSLAVLAVLVCTGNSGDGGDLWVLVIQGWLEISPFRQERNEEGLLQTQSWNATLSFPGATAISGDGEELPWSSHEALKFHGVSIIPSRAPAEPVPGCWCPPRAASTAKKTKEDPYYILQSPSFPQGWQGTRSHGGLVLIRFGSRGDLFAFCNF